MGVFGHSGCIRAKEVVFGKKLLYLGIGGCIPAKWLYSSKCGCIRAKFLFLGKSGCIRAKVVVVGLK